MELHIRPVRPEDIEAIVQLSLLAWEPVFESFAQVLGPAVYSLVWPDWRASQRAAVEGVCKDGEKASVLVAEVDDGVAGFLAYVLNRESRVGEVHLLAVHPDCQNAGVGAALNAFALQKMKEGGMRMAQVETGGDPAHAPARRCYEKAGYIPLPIVRYFKSLE
ncbi:MAG: GNAT family N-acetyltransferase [Anaerolineae bacterium]|nr:GNAT family N-acetyltransferase [Anaerolineae bacterium]